MKYSLLSLVRNALSGNRGWKPAWREPEPKRRYDIIIVGGGGHGLATAYYLAEKPTASRRVALLEKGWISAAGNVGRNTTIVRANYLLAVEPEPFYSIMSLRLWEGMEQELNFNAMMSQRGVHQPVPFRRPARCLHRAARQRHAAVRCEDAELRHPAKR
jgi:glycine/D-amino acid oxidase-like deaminating enzyme